MEVERLISSQLVIDLSTAYNIYNQTELSEGAKVIGLSIPTYNDSLSLAVLPS